MLSIKVEDLKPPTSAIRGTGCCGIVYITSLSGAANGTLSRYNPKTGVYEACTIGDEIKRIFPSGFKDYAAIHFSDVGVGETTNGEGMRRWFIEQGYAVHTHSVGKNNKPSHGGHLRLYTVYINQNNPDNKKLSVTKEYTFEQEEQERATAPTPVRTRVRKLRATTGGGVRKIGGGRGVSGLRGMAFWRGPRL